MTDAEKLSLAESANEVFQTIIQSLMDDVASERKRVDVWYEVALDQCNKSLAWRALVVQMVRKISAPLTIAECIRDEAIEAGIVYEKPPAETKGGAT